MPRVLKGGVHLTLYCDESIDRPLTVDKPGSTTEYWDYMAILLVPDDRKSELLSRLLNARCLSSPPQPWGQCSDQCRWHAQNDTEVHYSDLDSTGKFKVACSWLNMLLRQNRDGLDLVYFYILGLNRSQLDPSCFGPASQAQNLTVYNRFFRTAVQKSAKSFFSSHNEITIDRIVHHVGSEAHHPWFPWHSIMRLARDDDRLQFGCEEIEFRTADHRSMEGDSSDGHFLQLIDLILGCTVNILHLTSRDGNKVEASLLLKPLVERILQKPANVNSSYHYVGRQEIEFFPRPSLLRLDEDGALSQMTVVDSFYKLRELAIEQLAKPKLF